ncbi:DUF86 domain-containing protein [Mucilaginibacter sp. RS28]|uniref:DUF86 domain-containing protein n=1 Tax=Mucilaginibacter straminoryzae TaxID=2932774 RepID=A0A9X1X7D9_9SPHI|nr:DUF86 domain-containing protein [Mucilaginibacter straminoryzae]MCJ8211790.1 DUF86 domain-containing protein [Mucilaginibacter straminoryzae]
MSKSDAVYLSDIRESVDIILKYTANVTEQEFLNDTMLQDAVIRRLEIIGEAASKLSNQFIVANPAIPWKLMKAMRNKHIHEYSGVSPSTIYSTIIKDIPILQTQLDQLG